MTAPTDPPDAAASSNRPGLRTLVPRAGRSRAEAADAAAAEHRRRHELASSLAAEHDGVVTRQELLAAGLTRGEIRAEIDRGVWHTLGWRTVSVSSATLTGTAPWWRALWESGARSVLDGPTALLAGGLKGWSEDVIHVAVPNSAMPRPIPGVSHHRPRDLGDTINAGLRRTKPAVAAIRAAQWARSDRQAATVLAMTVQQRLTTPAAVLDRWAQVRRTARRAVLTGIIGDVCNGAHTLAELDFARLSRGRGLPDPPRQGRRTGPERFLDQVERALALASGQGMTPDRGL